VGGDGLVRLLGADPRSWLLESGEPAARWVALTQLPGISASDSEISSAHAAVLADPSTGELIGRIPDWEAPQKLSGHASPAFAPNLLNLLADMGVAAGDDPRIEAVLDQMEINAIDGGRFATNAVSRVTPDGAWSSLLCDHHAITEVLVRFGRSTQPAVQRALEITAGDVTDTAQGPAWHCPPDATTGFRGPGRKADLCPQVSLEALRTFSRLASDPRPDGLDAVVSTLLGVWRNRGEHKPYLFGHGIAFKTVKWPPLWYGILGFLDAIGRYPAVWGSDADPADRAAVMELIACLVAYNVDGEGKVTPRSAYRGFGSFSFGQKKQPSPFATARVAAVATRFGDLADDVAAVDVTALTSSKGGTGPPVPPPT